jgi:hypothetical protein
MSWFSIPQAETAHTKAKAAPLSANFQAIEDAFNGLFKAGKVKSSGDLTLTTSFQDVPDATLSITPAIPSLLIVTATFDFDSPNGQGRQGPFEGELNVDAASQVGEAIYTGGVAAGDGGRATVAQNWMVTLAAGAHTVKLRAKATPGLSDICRGTHTGFTYLLIPNPSP